MRRLAIFVAVASGLMLLPLGPAVAATDPACGAPLKGRVKFTHDVDCPGGYTVAKAETVIDLGGHAISGDGTGVGISVPDRRAVVIKNGTVTGFETGISASGKLLNIQDMTATQNSGAGIEITGSKKVTLKRNVATDNGGTGLLIAPAVATVSSNTAEDNGEHGISATDSPDVKLGRGGILNNASDNDGIDCFPGRLCNDSQPDDDDDLDTFVEPEDCDDTDDTVHPDATEIPNGVDDDCDGATDEDPLAIDDDGDTYTENDGDCDDTDDTVHPGATEIPNGVDDDCDGATDEDPLAIDDDGDTYTENAGDCDDTDPSIHPDAAEVRGNGIDEDCDASDATTPLLISEVGARPFSAGGEFVSIVNPTGSRMSLDGVYLSDTPSYHAIACGTTSTIDTSDFSVTFPVGSSIAPGVEMSISLRSAAAYATEYGSLPDFDLDADDTQAPTMTGRFTPGSTALTNGGEMVVLFETAPVEGVSYVRDHDYLVYGTTVPMDKTGASCETHSYANETQAASQSILVAPAAQRQVYERCDAEEGTETSFGGNGVNGEDETSENLTTTFRTAALATPGVVANCA